MKNEKLENFLAEIQKGKDQINAIKKELETKIQSNFHNVSKELFIMYPELKSFGWTQYTPYFNDGEECVFSANIDDPTINGFDYYGDREGDDDLINIYKDASETAWSNSKEIPNPTFNPYYKEIVESIQKFLANFDDDDYRSIFDNHVSVTVTADGVQVEEYEHD